MSSEPVISLRGAGKCYNFYDRPSDRLKQMVANRLPAGLRKTHYHQHWALRGVNLDIARGETVGIIGQNGSGKSTLLQLISGTLAPSEGEVRVAGRVAPLLQLGAGFNPEFTGSENVALNAAILGLSADEIENRFDDIVTFSDIGEMLDRPVKLYSSGMYARLAFAVAIHVDPEILIIDEALAVGDEAFQRKCFARIAAIRRSGATILFVSHASNTVAQLCNRAYLLDRGELISYGHPRPVILRHNRLSYAMPEHTEALRARLLAEMTTNGALEWPSATQSAPGGPLIATAHSGGASAQEAPPGEDSPVSDSASGSFFDPGLKQSGRPHVFPEHGASIISTHVETEDGRQVNVLAPDEQLNLLMRVQFTRHIENVRFSWTVRTNSGLVLAGGSTHRPGEGFEHFAAGETVVARFPFQNIFNAGVFTIDVGVRGLVVEYDDFAHNIAEAIVIRTLDRTGYRNGLVDCHREPGVTVERVAQPPFVSQAVTMQDA